MLRASEITVVGAINASLETDGQSEQTPRVPVLAIYAGSPLASRQVVLSHVPQAEYIEITDSGHLLMLEKPAEFNRILLEFLVTHTKHTLTEDAVSTCCLGCRPLVHSLRHVRHARDPVVLVSVSLFLYSFTSH